MYMYVIDLWPDVSIGTFGKEGLLSSGSPRLGTTQVRHAEDE